MASRHIQIRNQINAVTKEADKGAESPSFCLHGLRHLFAANDPCDGESNYGLQFTPRRPSTKMTAMHLNHEEPVIWQRALHVRGTGRHRSWHSCNGLTKVVAFGAPVDLLLTC